MQHQLLLLLLRRRRLVRHDNHLLIIVITTHSFFHLKIIFTVRLMVDVALQTLIQISVEVVHD